MAALNGSIVNGQNSGCLTTHKNSLRPPTNFLPFAPSLRQFHIPSGRKILHPLRADHTPNYIQHLLLTTELDAKTISMTFIFWFISILRYTFDLLDAVKKFFGVSLKSPRGNKHINITNFSENNFGTFFYFLW